ncbi:MAG: hypothetical protein ACRDWD_16235 [Acidimicrobiia bacterium]
MAVEEVRVRLRRKLEGIVGAEETSYLMDRPPGGWTDLLTNQSLTDKLDALRHEMRAEIGGLRTEVREGFAAIRGEAAETRGSFDSKLSELSASAASAPNLGFDERADHRPRPGLRDSPLRLIHLLSTALGSRQSTRGQETVRRPVLISPD